VQTRNITAGNYLEKISFGRWDQDFPGFFNLESPQIKNA
jgi:hypothetical protein